MSYRVKRRTKDIDHCNKLGIESFDPRSEPSDRKKVQSKLLLLSKSVWTHSHTKYKVSIFQEAGGEEVRFELWMGYIYDESQDAFKTIKHTLAPLLINGSVLLTKPLLKEIVLPAPMGPEEIPSHLIDVMERRPDAHPEWLSVIQALANSPDLPPTNKASRKDYLALLKTKLLVNGNFSIDKGLEVSSLVPFVALPTISQSIADEEESNRIWTQFRRGTLTAHVHDSQANDKTKTWLMDAVEKKHMKSTMNLVLSCVDTNERHPSTGDTALHIAVRQGNVALVKLLLAYQADPTIPNAKDETPIEAAEKLTGEYREEIKAVLKAVQDGRVKAKLYYEHNSELPEKKNSSDVFLLSLDGGGMRSVIMCHILAAIERRMEELCHGSNKYLQSYFDYFAGTSAGAIIEAALLYDGIQSKFTGMYLYKFMFDVFGCNKAERSDRMKGFVTNIVGEDTVMSDLQDANFIVTSSIANISPNKLHLMTSYGKARDGQKGPKERKVWEAILASSAAPTYFPAFEHFLDGGLIANNPTLPAMADIFEQAKKDDKKVKVGCVLSLGTGYMHPPQMVDDFEVYVPGFTMNIFESLFRSSKGLVNLFSHFIDQTTQSNGEVVRQAKSWCDSLGAQYLRFSPPLHQEVPPDTICPEDMISLLFDTELYILEEYESIDRAAKLMLSK